MREHLCNTYQGLGQKVSVSLLTITQFYYEYELTTCIVTSLENDLTINNIHVTIFSKMVEITHILRWPLLVVHACMQSRCLRPTKKNGLVAGQ